MWKKFAKSEKQLWEMELGFKFDKGEWEVKSNELRIKITKDKKTYGFAFFLNPTTVFYLGKIAEFMKKQFKDYFGIESEMQGYQIFTTDYTSGTTSTLQ